MSKSWNMGLIILAALVIILLLGGPLRLASVVLYRLGKIGVIAVLVMLAYALVRKKG